MKNKIIKKLKENKSLIFALFSLFATVEFIGIINLILSANLIDSLIIKNFNYSYNIVKLIIILTIISTIVNYIFSIYKEKITQDFSFYIEKKSFENIYNSEYIQIKKIDKLTLSQKILKDSINISSFIFNNLFSFIVSIITIVSLFIILGNKHMIFFIISFVTIPIYLLLIYYIRNYIHPSMHEARENRDIFSGSYINKIQNIYTVKSFSIINKVFTSMSKLYSKKLNSILKEYKIFYFFYSIEGLFTLIVQTFFFFLGIKYIINETLTIGDFTVILSFYQLIIKNINYYLMLGKDYEDFNISINRLDEIENINKDNIGNKSINAIKSITFNNTNYNIIKNKCLNYKKFTLNSGEIIKLEGSNGIGKSTLINILLGLYPSSDVAFINNIDVSEINMNKLRADLISYLPQNFEFIDGTALDNINFYSISEYTDEDIIENLQILKLNLNVKEINNILNKNINNLSEGQKQIIALIIIFIKNKNFIILDEPFKGLDCNNKEIIINYLNKIKNSKLILIIEHNSINDLEYRTIEL